MGARLMGAVLVATALNDIGALRGPADTGLNTAMDALWLIVILLFLLFAGGGLVRKAAMRAALYDESTIEHGRRSLAVGFWGALLASAVCWVLSRETPVDGPQVARAVITFSVAIVLMTFATLEMKALKE